MLRIERIREDIAALGRRAAAERVERQGALDQALRWLAEAPDADELRARVQPLIGQPDRWRGAVPTSPLPVGATMPCPEVSLDGLVLIGVDGSQIYPDRHALILYYLLQVGSLIFRYNHEAPGAQTSEWLRYEESDVYDDRGYLIGAETLAMERMVKEMVVLADLVDQEHHRSESEPAEMRASTIVGLSDGPLLWPYEARNQKSAQACGTYLNALRRVQLGGGVPVGYVDRPGGRPLLDLLWAGQLPSEELLVKIDDNPLGTLSDEDLMKAVLAPGARTGWFTRPTPTNQRHAEEGQEIWFCYVNLGSAESPAIARAEAPAWVAVDAAVVDQLQATLRHQAMVLGGYPYVLARAHEEALVTTQDKAALEQAIQRELLMATGELAEPSDKAKQKALLGQR